MGHIKVSVILPALNVASFIRECLESVRLQTLPGIEILCVDAGSTDGTLEIIQDYAGRDSRIRLIVSDRKSYGYQMNLGIMAARGEYIGILETDDYIVDDMYMQLYQAAHDNKLDFVKAEYYGFVDYRGRRLYERYIRNVHGMYHQVILLREMPQARLYGGYCNIWAGIYNRDFLLKNRIFFHESDGAAYQDAGFAILCSLAANRIMFLNQPFYRYRKDNEGSSIRAQEKYICTIEEFRWIKSQMMERGFTDKISRTLYMIFKIDTYRWNYYRLLPDYRQAFLRCIKDEEMDDFDESLLGFEILEKEKMLRLWRGDWSAVPEQDEQDRIWEANAERIMSCFRQEERIVVVSAGKWGQALAGLDEVLDLHRICAVCDNDKGKLGKRMGNHTIREVGETVRQYPDAFYIIANKRSPEELQAQLERSGIGAEQIYMNQADIPSGPAVHYMIVKLRMKKNEE